MSKPNDMEIETLDLDMDNLNDLQEVYMDKDELNLDNDLEEVSLNNDNVKTILLDTNNSEDNMKKEVLKNYIRKRDYSFFSDANEN